MKAELHQNRDTTPPSVSVGALGDAKTKTTTAMEDKMMRMMCSGNSADDLKFVIPRKTELLCYRKTLRNGRAVLHDSNDDSYSPFCNRERAMNFIKTMPEGQETRDTNEQEVSLVSTFSFIGGFGNGTVHPLSLDRPLFEHIVAVFRLPDRVPEAFRSVHGICARFLEYDGKQPRSLLILLATPKTPARELMFAIRVDLRHSSIICFLFDARRPDLERIASLVQEWATRDGPKPILELISIMLKDCGRTTEVKRRALASHVLEAEIQTRSTAWYRPKEHVVRWPDDFYEATSALNLCHNNLVFVSQAAAAETTSWDFLRSMAEEAQLKPWLRGTAGTGEWVRLIDAIEFEAAHSRSRRSRIESLKERVGVQVNLISNLIAHKESFRMNIIAIVALVFAPASLIASIFSAGIFETNNHSWVAFISSVVPITVLALAFGIGSMQREKMLRFWRQFQAYRISEGMPQTKEHQV